jgi:hypothetical protein
MLLRVAPLLLCLSLQRVRSLPLPVNVGEMPIGGQRKQGLRVSSEGAAGSEVFEATSRIVAEYPELQFW